MKKIVCIAILIIIFILLSLSFCFGLDVENDVNQNNVIRVGFDPNLPPYQYYENGEYKGLDIDLINKIAEKGHFNIELIPLPMNECIQKFQNREIQMVLGIRYLNYLENIMGFSDSLVKSSVSIIVLSERADEIKNVLNVEPLIIAVERDSAEYEFVKNIKKANYNTAFNQESVIQLLLMGRADMMVGVRHVAEYMLEKHNLSDKYKFSNTYETPVDYYIGVSKEYPGLLKIIDTELRYLKLDGEYEKIYDKWIDDKNLLKQKKIVGFLTAFLTAAFLVIIGTLFISLQLKRRVNEKTKELVNINNELEDKITEIRHSNELKDLILESSPRSIVIFDNDGVITIMNENALKICNCTHPLIGESVFDLIPVNLMLSNYIESVLKYGQRYMGVEMEYKSKERSCVYRFAIYPLFDYEKKTRGAIITIEDITDEKLIREQAEEKEKNRVLTQIISGIAHEIRNPLTSIKTYIELLPKKKDNLEFQKQISTIVPHEVERVDTLITQLIDYTKPKPKNIEFVVVSDLIESCVLLFKPVIDRNNIDLNLNINENLYIKVDKNHIKQVIINLLLNAIDAICEIKQNNTDKLYRININTYEIGNSIEITVEDNGIGMTKDELKKVFDLFYTTKSNGTGIGLSLSKQIVEENEGKIEIESEKCFGTKIVISFQKINTQ